MKRQAPSIGRIVHYVSHGTPVRSDGTQAYQSVCRAAIVTGVEVDGDDPNLGLLVSLCVMNPTGLFFQEELSQDQDGHTGGTWHWPEMV